MQQPGKKRPRSIAEVVWEEPRRVVQAVFEKRDRDGGGTQGTNKWSSIFLCLPTPHTAGAQRQKQVVVKAENRACVERGKRGTLKINIVHILTRCTHHDRAVRQVGLATVVG